MPSHAMTFEEIAKASVRHDQTVQQTRILRRRGGVELPKVASSVGEEVQTAWKIVHGRS